MSVNSVVPTKVELDWKTVEDWQFRCRRCKQFPVSKDTLLFTYLILSPNSLNLGLGVQMASFRMELHILILLSFSDSHAMKKNDLK